MDPEPTKCPLKLHESSELAALVSQRVQTCAFPLAGDLVLILMRQIPVQRCKGLPRSMPRASLYVMWDTLNGLLPRRNPLNVTAIGYTVIKIVSAFVYIIPPNVANKKLPDMDADTTRKVLKGKSRIHQLLAGVIDTTLILEWERRDYSQWMK